MADGDDVPAPVVFLSYSWTDSSHEQWVLDLATELQNAYRITIRLDKWHVGGPGGDPIQYMESMVTDPSVGKVLIISDRLYAEKADGREGGVGIEAQILTPHLYKQAGGDGKPQKFAVVVTEKDERGRGIVPAFYGGRLYIDMTDPDRRSERLVEIQRWAYDRPVHVPPPLGGRPDFLSDGPTTGTDGLSRRALSALIGARSDAVRTVEDYFDMFAEGLSEFIPGEQAQLELATERLSAAYLEAERVVLELSRARLGERGHAALRRFFESLFPYLRPEHDDGAIGIKWDWQTDPFDFIVPELFRSAICALIRAGDFEGVFSLTSIDYVVTKHGGRLAQAFPFPHFQSGVHDPSLRGKIRSIRERRGSLFPLVELIQADVILSLLAYHHRSDGGFMTSYWYPDLIGEYERQTLHTPLPTFAKAASRSHLSRLAVGFGLSPDGLRELVVAISDMDMQEKRRHGLASVRYAIITNSENIGSKQ